MESGLKSAAKVYYRWKKVENGHIESLNDLEKLVGSRKNLTNFHFFAKSFQSDQLFGPKARQKSINKEFFNFGSDFLIFGPGIGTNRSVFWNFGVNLFLGTHSVEL